MNDEKCDFSPELQDLVSDLLDGKLSESGEERLRSLLRNNPRAQDEYRHFMAVHALLHLDFGEGRLHLLPPVAQTQGWAQAANEAPARNELADDWGRAWHGRARSWLQHRYSKRHWQIAATLSAMAVAALLLIASYFSLLPLGPADTNDIADSRESRNMDQMASAVLGDMEAVAVIGQASRARWSDPQLPVDRGSTLRAGNFVLKQGLIQLEFFSGAAVVIEAPAEFELISADQISCRLGRIRAHVPSQAKGFTITTPTHAAVDLGTEFTVQVDPTGGSEFQVLDGEVHLLEGDSEQSVLAQRLTAGQSVRSTSEGELLEVASPDSEFVGRKEMLQRASDALHERYEHWQQFSGKIRNDEHVLVYYGFDGHAAWERVLRNESPSHNELLHGAIVGCQWTSGRWAGKQALEFKRTTDRVRLNVPGEYESLTFAAWLRIEGLERWLSSLMLTDGHQPGELHWQMTEQGQLMLGVKAEPDQSHDFYSPSIIGPKDLGRWVHLACVYNGAAGYVSHIVDGVEVSRESVRIPTKLRVGPAEIGNWVPQELKNYRIRSLNGRIDEFILFDRALTGDEVAAIYEAGRAQ